MASEMTGASGERKTTDVSFLPIGDEKPAEAIYNQIRQKIIEGEIETGSRLPSERKMMEIFGRSRSTIREALRLLAQDGYVTTVSRSSGAIVTEPGVELVADSLGSMIQMQNLDIAHVMEFRRLTECTVASLAARRRTDSDLEKIRRYMEKSEKVTGKPKKFAEYDFEFHMAIYRASQNEVFSLMLQVCREVINERLTATLKRGEDSDLKARYAEIMTIHRAIYNAIRLQQEEEAYRMMERHLLKAETDVLQ